MSAWEDDSDRWEAEQDGLAGKMSFCRDCNGTIVWLRTKNDKKIAVEFDECDDDDEEFDGTRHKCHWDICPATRYKNAGDMFGGLS